MPYPRRIMPSTNKHVYTKEQIVSRNKAQRKWQLKNKGKVAQYKKKFDIKYRQDQKEAVHKFLGNKCKNCGENDPIYFQIDHVHNDGSIERKGSGTGRTHTLKKYLEDPERYQLLCANCNWAKRMNGGKLYKPKKRRKAA